MRYVCTRIKLGKRSGKIRGRVDGGDRRLAIGAGKEPLEKLKRSPPHSSTTSSFFLFLARRRTFPHGECESLAKAKRLSNDEPIPLPPSTSLNHRSNKIEKFSTVMNRAQRTFAGAEWVKMNFSLRPTFLPCLRFC